MQHITQTTARPVSRPAKNLASRIAQWLLQADRRYREKRHVSRLSSDQLRDIGLSRSDLADR